MPGTGLYAAKVTPTHSDDTQSGAPVGQVVTLTTGGLGTADAFKGGYVTNATRSELRAIVSHTDGTVTLEGDLSAWLDTDDLDIYDGWSTIQAAHDQLFTDQGATLFTSIQELRLYGGTFTENVVCSLSLTVDFENFLWVRAATGETPIIDGGSSDCWSKWPYRHSRFEGITFASTGTARGLANSTIQRGLPLEVRDCIFNTASGIYQNHSQYGTFVITGCVFSLTNNYATNIIAGSLLMRGCTISGGINQVIQGSGQRVEIETCTFRNASTGIYTADSGSAVSVKNCSFYGLTVADIISEWTQGVTHRSISDLVALNNIHEDSALVYWLPSRTRLSNVDRNCIHNATKVARVNATDYTTLADWQAYADDTGASPDANSFTDDPLLTDPANGDFSLGTGSPCLHAGAGAGVKTGVNGVDFDPYHPDMGAWSSGVCVAPTAPSVSATDQGNQSDVTVDIVADNPADVSTIFYQSIASGTVQVWGTTVTGSGSETITGLSTEGYVFWATAERCSLTSESSTIDFESVAAADQYTATRTTLYEWVKGVVGNPVVIWRNPNAPQPTRQYVSIHMGPTTVVGHDYHGGADTNGVSTVTGDREFVFSIQIHGKPSNEDGSASISILERLRSSLEKRSIQSSLSAGGAEFVAIDGSGDLAGIGGTQFEARVFMDIRFRTAYQDTDDVGYIATADPVGTLE